jgi:hypothetical protein
VNRSGEGAGVVLDASNEGMATRGYSDKAVRMSSPTMKKSDAIARASAISGDVETL